MSAGVSLLEFFRVSQGTIALRQHFDFWHLQCSLVRCLRPCYRSSTNSNNLHLESFLDEERLVFNRETPSTPTYCCINACFTSFDYHRNTWMADIGAETGGLFLVIFISSFSIVCAIVRLIAPIIYAKLPNTNWGLPLIPFVSAMEAYVALITSSIPAIYPLIFRPKTDSRSSNLQQRWRFDGEWLSNVNTLGASRPDTGSSIGVSGVENGGRLPMTRQQSGLMFHEKIEIASMKSLHQRFHEPLLWLTLRLQAVRKKTQLQQWL